MKENIENFLADITVIDLETTGIDPFSCEIVEMATAMKSGDTWLTWSKLFGSRNPIPPESSAVNNISNSMVKDLSLWTSDPEDSLQYVGVPLYYVAHGSEYHRQVLFNNLHAANKPKLAENFLDKKHWICTQRLAKQVFENSKDIKYSLNYLRYYLDLPITTTSRYNNPQDVELIYLLLEKLVSIAQEKGLIDPLEENIGEQLSELCWKPLLIKHWSVGKHKGSLLSEMPNDYFYWAIDKLPSLNPTDLKYDPDLEHAVKTELESRLVTTE
jgi:hypothetical protein